MKPHFFLSIPETPAGDLQIRTQRSLSFGAVEYSFHDVSAKIEAIFFVRNRSSKIINNYFGMRARRYKSEMNDVNVQTVAGSTLPLVQLPRDEESYDYNPYEHRKVPHPTT